MRGCARVDGGGVETIGGLLMPFYRFVKTHGATYPMPYPIAEFIRVRK